MTDTEQPPQDDSPPTFSEEDRPGTTERSDAGIASAGPLTTPSPSAPAEPGHWSGRLMAGLGTALALVPVITFSSIATSLGMGVCGARSSPACSGFGSMIVMGPMLIGPVVILLLVVLATMCAVIDAPTWWRWWCRLTVIAVVSMVVSFLVASTA